MEKNNKIILIGIIILTTLVLIFCGYLVFKKRDYFTDAQKFRREYLNLNGKTNNNGDKYPEVTISIDNTVIYATEEKIIELLENGTGVIYFGFDSCPWCRTLISPLLKIAKEMEEPIYYLDIKDIKSVFEIKDGELINTKKGTKGYYKILELLDDYLDEYYLTDDDFNDYDTYEKRLYAPTLVAVKNGLITKTHVGTVDSQENGYDKLSQDQLNELENIIKDLINSKN